jgi:hypothetical protein
MRFSAMTRKDRPVGVFLFLLSLNLSLVPELTKENEKEERERGSRDPRSGDAASLRACLQGSLARFLPTSGA